jgi:hypothetical protein
VRRDISTDLAIYGVLEHDPGGSFYWEIVAVDHGNKANLGVCDNINNKIMNIFLLRACFI